MVELGGFPVYLPPGQVQIGEREPPEDVARNLSRWCHAIVARTYGHDVIEMLATHASVPVVNALTDLLHPCQAMADALTIREHGDLLRDEVCYIGDGNNMCHSLLNLAGCLGMRMVACTPPGYAPDAGNRGARERARRAQRRADPLRRGSARGREVRAASSTPTSGRAWDRRRRQRPGAPSSGRTRSTRRSSPRRPRARSLLHCLPAHRGEEITADVLESDRSIVFDQAENRLHAQKAILELLITG